MNRRFGVVLLGSLLMGCGDYTSPDAGSGGSSTGSGAQGGGGAGVAGDGGKAQGGQGGQGGAIVGGIGGGGSGGLAGSGTSGSGGGEVDPRCPAQQPMGRCSDSAGLFCEYDTRGCLCYEGYDLCMPVDPSCASFPPTPPAESGGNSSGGFSTKIPPRPRIGCNCPAGWWVCSL